MPMNREIPATESIRSEILYFEGDGERIEGILCLPEHRPDPCPLVAVAHGFGGNYHFYTGNIARALAEGGFAAYAFNFRNPDTRVMLGTSPLTEAKTLGIVLDGIGKLPWVDRERLYLLGESQGGFVSAYVSAMRAKDPARNDVKGLILYYPAFVLQDDAKERNPGWESPEYVWPETEVIGENRISGSYSRDALSFDIYKVIRAYANPVLLVHGTADPVVPLRYSERARETYADAQLKIIEGAGHGFYFGEPFALSVEYTLEALRGWAGISEG